MLLFGISGMTVSGGILSADEARRTVTLSEGEISLCMKVLDPSLHSGCQEAGRRHIERSEISLCIKLFCSFLSFCCDQKERNATKERKNAAKTKSGIFLLKL